MPIKFLFFKNKLIIVNNCFGKQRYIYLILLYKIGSTASSGNFSILAGNKAYIEEFVSSSIKFLIRNDFDGLGKRVSVFTPDFFTKFKRDFYIIRINKIRFRLAISR